MPLWHTTQPFIDLGYIPEFLIDDDPRPAAEQFNERYAHGGGWRPQRGWTFLPDNSTIKYPGEPALAPLAWTTFNEEAIFFYPSAWVCIVKPDCTYEVARMD